MEHNSPSGPTNRVSNDSLVVDYTSLFTKHLVHIIFYFFRLYLMISNSLTAFNQVFSTRDGPLESIFQLAGV